MNKIIKFAIGASAAVAMLATATPAFAASISNPLFSNNQTAIDAQGGSTVNGTFTLTVGPGETCEWFRTQADPSQPFKDASVGGTLGFQEQVYTGIPFSVVAPPNTGTYYPTVQCAGNVGGNRAINGGDTNAGSVIWLSSTGLGTVRVVANASTDVPEGTTPPGWNASDWAAFQQWKNSQNSTPAPSSKCAILTTKLAGTVDNAYSAANKVLQGFLISEGFDYKMPALSAGASFGYKGDQTRSAVEAFKTANSCN